MRQLLLEVCCSQEESDRGIAQTDSLWRSTGKARWWVQLIEIIPCIYLLRDVRKYDRIDANRQMGMDHLITCLNQY